LFEGDLYDRIRQTPAELAFQLFLLDVALSDSRNELSKDYVYVRNLRFYEYFALFSLAVRVLTEVGIKWGNPDLTAQLRVEGAEDYLQHYNLWKKVTKMCIDQIVAAFKKESRRYARRGGEELTYANYFKNQSYVARILKMRLKREIKRYARAALRA
jgi:hypothetical protein